MRNEQVIFSKPRVVKKKHLKGKDTPAIFGTSKDLSMGDNSSILLLEYSEEYPTMMSNFGMGSRLINYYRRKDMEDNSRPKLDIGETTVLLPQDKSPFSLFGHIDPGQITPALYNAMYKAPIFKHQTKPSDFLVIRNSTGVEGHTYYMRNIENLHVVGQEFPSVDVPGPHSRKVTTASKNRLKMISYRLIRHGKTHRVGVDQITKHFIDTTDMQNRQKMKEFMQFSKEHKQWVMRPGEAVPDEETIRAMIKPEDVCLLESMQVGQQHLQDAGFSKGDDDSEDEDGKEGQSIEQQLAPWFTSRNFLNAAQGKAMLQLHGEGDPSGRGEAFSFIKTSMKGGFKAMGESVEDKLDAKKLKELGGHSYNVARQQKQYEDSIRRVWDAQKQSLSSSLEQSDTDMEDDHIEEPDDLIGGARTPRSEAQTSATLRRRDDETMSQFSRFSTESQSGKVLRITRNIRNTSGNLERIQDTIHDPRVIRQYLKRRHAKEAETTMHITHSLNWKTLTNIRKAIRNQAHGWCRAGSPQPAKVVMLLTCNGLCTERCEGSRKNLRVLNATKIAGLLVTSRKAYILFSTQMVRPILQVRQPLLLPQRRRTPAPSANAPIAVKSATSKPTKSASYHLIYNLSPAFCYPFSRLLRS